MIQVTIVQDDQGNTGLQTTVKDKKVLLTLLASTIQAIVSQLDDVEEKRIVEATMLPPNGSLR